MCPQTLNAKLLMGKSNLHADKMQATKIRLFKACADQQAYFFKFIWLLQ